MNIEHRTLNVQHRIMYSVNLKKRLSKANLPFEIQFGCLRQAQDPSTSRGAPQAAVFRSRLQRGWLVLK